MRYMLTLMTAAAMTGPLMAQTMTPPADAATMPPTASPTTTAPEAAAPPGSAGDASTGAAATTPAAAPADAAAARAALEAQGYSRVTGLARQPDGGWAASAHHGGKKQNVTIAPDGAVSPPQQ